MVVREDARRKVVSEGDVTVEYVAFLGTRHRMMQPLLLTVPAHQRYQCDLFEHGREEMIHVLSGELLVRAKAKEIHVASGDVAYFLFDPIDSFENTTSRPARALWVVSPAYCTDES